MRRTGSALDFLWAPGAEGNDFQEIKHTEFWDDDIDEIRVFALNGLTPSDVDVRLLDLRIRGQELGIARVAPARGGLALALFFGFFVTLALALGAWFFLRRRRPA